VDTRGIEHASKDVSLAAVPDNLIGGQIDYRPPCFRIFSLHIQIHYQDWQFRFWPYQPDLQAMVRQKKRCA
jgi:hypothetical protein